MTGVIDTKAEAPFLGLRYFDEEHAHLFFGRDVQINDILGKLRRSRLVTVMGSSGSGKSSLVRAGVIPRLKAGLLGESGPSWRVAKMRPGSSPIASLARELEKALSAQELDVTLRRGPLGLVQAVAECRLHPRENVLVIADQFEELFRYQREATAPEQAKQEAAAFVKLLLEATSQRALRIFVIVTMRSDYLGNCAQFRDLPERINDGLYLVPRMRRDQLEQAITGPAAVEDAEIAPPLLQSLLNETGDDPDQLPVLQHALMRTWHAWNHAARRVDMEDLDAVGGLKDGLSRHANEIFARLSIDQQRIARIMFQQLCERDAEGREIRRPAPITLVAAVADTSVEAVEQVVQKFAAPDAALLYRNEDGHLDITHESLIRKWTRIQGAKNAGSDAKGWMQEEVVARDQFLLLAERAAKKDTLVGRALEEALIWSALPLNADWARRYTKPTATALSFADVRAFVAASQKKEIAGRRLRRNLVVTALVVLPVVVAVIFLLWRSAARQADAAGTALGHASVQEAARLAGANKPAEALAHLARALRSDPDSLVARSWMSDLVLNERVWVVRAFFNHDWATSTVAFSADGRRVITDGGIWDLATGHRSGAPPDSFLENHGGDVRPVYVKRFTPAISRDERRVATRELPNELQLWDVASGSPIGVKLQHQDVIRAAAFSPDGRRVVTASADKTARFWDAATGQPVGDALQHQDAVHIVVFSPDGRRVLTASADAVRIWDAVTGLPVGAALQHEAKIHAARFSPDGRYIVTASADNTARVWDGVTGRRIGAALRHHDDVRAARFSPDGQRVVTASADNTARVWDALTGRPVGVPLQHQEDVHAAAFSLDGRRVVTASADDTARVWDAETGATIGAPLHHSADVLDAALSPDGRHVATACWDRGARVWELPGQPLPMPLQHRDSVTTAAFSADGRRVVTASADGTARLWDAFTGQSRLPALQHTDTVHAAAFSPDGRRVVTASADATARLWDADTGQPIAAPLQHQGAIHAVVFSPDGSRVVTASVDKTARLWDAATGQAVGAPLGHDDVVHAVTFTPDGRYVVTLSKDNTARIWDTRSGQEVDRISHVPRPINAAAFSPDGLHLVIAFGNLGNIQNPTIPEKSAHIFRWKAPSVRMSTHLRHHDDVNAAAFSADGRRVLTVAADNTARVWDAATGQPIGAPSRHEATVHAAMFSPDGRRLVTAAADRTARIWDAATGQPVAAPLQHRDAVHAAAFSPDGTRIVTASADHTARIWQVLLHSPSADSGKLLADLAEIAGGHRVTDLSSVVVLEEPERVERLRRFVGPASDGFVPIEVLLRRFLSNQP